MLSDGTIVHGYRVERFVGRGGMGEVYRATQLELDRDRRAQGHDRRPVRGPGLAERFRREARAGGVAEPPESAADPRGWPFRRPAVPVDALHRRADLAQVVGVGGPLDPARAAASSSRLQPRSTPHTPAGSSTATSSRPTSCWSRPASRRSTRTWRTSAWPSRPARSAPAHAHRPGRRHHRVPRARADHHRRRRRRSDVYALGCMLFSCSAARPRSAATPMSRFSGLTSTTAAAPRGRPGPGAVRRCRAARARQASR